MKVIIDDKSGFCFGVKKAIALAEENLSTKKHLYCLGDIVHNENEVKRLADLGLDVISREQYYTLSNCSVLLRAHGEPPEIFQYAITNNIQLIDGTCPVVSKLQQKVCKSYDQLNGVGSLIVFGKPEHPEVVGINGQINNNAIVVQNIDDLKAIDYSKPIVMYSQTTMSREKYTELKMEIEKRAESPDLLDSNDTICGQVANRGPWLQEFSQKVDAIVFAGGKKSSNSQVLFTKCKESNPNSFFVSNAQDIKNLKLSTFNSIGVCGATSTPQWLLEEVAEEIKRINA